MVCHKIGFLFVCIVLAGQMACYNKQRNIQPENQRLQLDIPENLPQSVLSPSRNPISKEGIALGRMLFYDPVLSADNKVSCATCHRKSLAFSDGVALSRQGVSGDILLRHSPVLINLAWHNGYFWDGGAHDLESQVFGPLTHPDEMAQDLGQLTEELQGRYDYAARFRNVFNDTIKSAYITRALAQFVRTLISADSKYDQYIRDEGAGLSEHERKGLKLFDKHCRNCHYYGKGHDDFFTDHQYHNNGLDSTFSNDMHEGIFQGRFRITGDSADMGKFKTPALRNVALTAPYMHDGRFETLKDVLDHYDEGVVASSTLDSALYRNNTPGLDLTRNKKNAIIAFLHTLTDEQFINNEKYANPFENQ